MLSLFTILVPFIIKVLGMIIDSSVQKKVLSKEQADRFIADLAAISKQLGTAADLRNQGQIQSSELDKYEQDIKKPQP
jgi:hypothetical protein